MISVHLAVSHQSNAVILHHCHRYTVTSTSGKVEETVVSDIVVWRQGTQRLKFRGSEKDVALLSKRPFPSAVNTHDSQLVIITCHRGGASRL